MRTKKIISVLAVLFLFAFGTKAQTDHADLIEGTFKTPQEVTKACLECHEDAAKEVMKTVHWTWEKNVTIPSRKGVFKLGKKDVFNNYCINLISNWPRCTSCHPGYGWKDATFDFSKEENVDCLICHDQTGKYKKNPAGAGMPKADVDLTAVAKSVGKPNRANCGACHFYGGGGENVKHGDLDHGLLNPDKNYDVHMAAGMLCTDCHKTYAHHIKGESLGDVTEVDTNRVYCTDCHKMPVHKSKVLNKHTAKVACQTCHIPYYAKGHPTKLYWDWSTAGKDSTGPKDKYGMLTYHKKKGSFKWGKNVVPEYAWYNGYEERYVAGDTFDPAKVLLLNKPLGDAKDKNAKLYPFKVMRGKQIYDAGYNYLVVPHLWGGYWKHFDWGKAAEEGMKEAGLKYSGKYGFVKTKMYWKLNHMVAPKEQALKCTACHGKGKNKRINWKALGFKGDQMYKKYRD